ncbi:MAG: hypothetical protein CMJ78_19405 [Planctomycetaceae bacterium]|nr:hypothetical protein [Planctomycetaceae bacterium]
MVHTHQGSLKRVIVEAMVSDVNFQDELKARSPAFSKCRASQLHGRRSKNKKRTVGFGSLVKGGKDHQ